MNKIKTLATRFHTKNIFYNDIDALSIFGRKVNVPFMRDRFGYLNNFSKFNITDKNDIFPKYNFTKSLE